MERIQVLIDKLVEQKAAGEPVSALLLTTQMLQTELLNTLLNGSKQPVSKVSVVLPTNTALQAANTEEDVIEQPAPAPVIKPAEVKKEPALPLQTVKEEVPVKKPTPAISFDAMEETPTLLQQKRERELHEVIADQKESLNDKLKQEKTELAHVLKDQPVKDLRKAIGVNDKFVFISELFRGDEVMYERSIKTINGFHILPEAEYWINRELKVKLGWNDSKEVVQHFYQLVRRRFS